MDKYLDRILDMMKGKSIVDIILLSSFIYLMYSNVIKDSNRNTKEKEYIELQKKQIEVTINQVNAINEQNKIFKAIEKDDKEFRQKVLINQTDQLHLLRQNNEYIIKLFSK